MTLQARTAVWDALYNTQPPETWSTTIAGCSTGNCTWDPFATIAVCSRCSNISEMIAQVDVGELLLPEAYNLTLDSTAYWNISHLDISDDPSIFRFATLTFPREDDRNSEGIPEPWPEAWDCELRYCVQVINSTVTGSHSTEEILGSYINTTWSSRSGKLTDAHDIEFSPIANVAHDYWHSLLNQTFHVQRTYVNGAKEWFQSVFTGNITQFSNMHGDTSSYQQESMALYQSKNVSELMTRIATSMSNELRVRNSTNFPGTMWLEQTVISVQWAWITLLIVAEILTIIFFLLTALQTNRGRVWKDNVLPMFFHGLDASTSTTLGRTDTMKAMESEAKALIVGLNDPSDGHGDLYLKLRTNETP